MADYSEEGEYYEDEQQGDYLDENDDDIMMHDDDGNDECDMQHATSNDLALELHKLQV